MKMYMGYDDERGSGDGAVLIFANNAREAKKLAWNEIDGWLWDAEYIDIRVRMLRNKEFLREQAQSDEPHAIDNPIICSTCEYWGVSELNEEGNCGDCVEARKQDDLMELEQGA